MKAQGAVSLFGVGQCCAAVLLMLCAVDAAGQTAPTARAQFIVDLIQDDAYTQDPHVYRQGDLIYISARRTRGVGGSFAHPAQRVTVSPRMGQNGRRPESGEWNL